MASVFFVKILLVLAIVAGPVLYSYKITHTDTTSDILLNMEPVMRQVDGHLSGTAQENKAFQDMFNEHEKQHHISFDKLKGASILAPFFHWYSKYHSITNSDVTTRKDV